jgi:pimeloyl-ACP methyl ester carboxylesterase
MMISPARKPLWAAPSDIDLAFEDVQFPARDGLRMSGWFIPGSQNTYQKGATIILIHGWTWNRLGYAADDLLANLTGSQQVNFLPLIKALHDEGYNILTYDQRNHGQSANGHPVTFGQGEAKDLLGAISFLENHDDVDPTRMGMVSFSMGANAAIFALPQLDRVMPLVAVQPMTPAHFAKRLAIDLFGVFGPVILPVAETIYRLFGGPRLAGINPAFAAGGSGAAPVMYIQGTGDRWGSAEDVTHMAELTPQAKEILFVSSHNRSQGYQYVIKNPGVVTAFFKQHLT